MHDKIEIYMKYAYIWYIKIKIYINFYIETYRNKEFFTHRLDEQKLKNLYICGSISRLNTESFDLLLV